MNLIKIAAVLAVASLLGAPPAAFAASSTIFDFGAIANNKGEQGVETPGGIDGFFNKDGETPGINEVSVRAEGFRLLPGAIPGVSTYAEIASIVGYDTPDAYFDKAVGNPPRDAGFGVCTGVVLLTAQCLVSGEDNVGVVDGNPEGLSLEFSANKQAGLTLTSWSFKDSGHYNLDSGKAHVSFNSGVNWEPLLFSNPNAVLGDGRYVFKGDRVLLVYDGTEFYNGTTVAKTPIPASAALLLAGAGALVVNRRRRKTAAA